MYQDGQREYYFKEFTKHKNDIMHPGCNEQAETLLAIFSFEAYVFILNPISFAICYNLLGIWMGKIIKITKTSNQDYDQ